MEAMIDDITNINNRLKKLENDKMTNENEIVQVQGQELVTSNVDQAISDWNDYQTITAQILDETDYQDIRGKKFKKKSAWRKYARAFNITTEIISKDIIRNDKGRVTDADFIVRATLPNGRTADGFGNCSKSEGNKSHPNHDIPATAMTRATNRAIADLIGAGEVTAEEMLSEERIRRNEERKISKGKTIRKTTDEIDVEVVK